VNLCRFDQDRLGLVEGATVYDVTPALGEIPAPKWPYPPGDPLIRHLDAVLQAAVRLRKSAASKPLSAVKLYSPVTSPTKIMAAPANYRAHIELDAKDAGVDAGVHAKSLEGVERPVEKFGLFLKASSALVGPAQGISLVMKDRRNDPEIELVVVIGRTGKDIPRAKAFEHVAGYSLGIDNTVRGAEDRSYRKSPDSYAVLGPWLTTRDAIRDPEDLTIWLEVNGERRQQSSTGVMIVKIAELIEIGSRIYTLHPGDLLYTGTPEGVSAIHAGDVLRGGCAAIGEMTIQVR
jgi:2-keto-4-pentenoate hydratase/2-oxohepta-3-ene-1,7-dioic acid hydratase in catechol pathway